MRNLQWLRHRFAITGEHQARQRKHLISVEVLTFRAHPVIMNGDHAATTGARASKRVKIAVPEEELDDVQPVSTTTAMESTPSAAVARMSLCSVCLHYFVRCTRLRCLCPRS